MCTIHLVALVNKIQRLYIKHDKGK
jgi:hypothetical protein